ncbi:MAG TPA: NAD(P)H-dependent glycerol-3-phosphate dehydrogenase [Methylomirabilota bacterium]|nr:NAD(P)H-dependent glycerol-3-phosphate dehydrogenase [Methylomirabilota bacterium]
MNVAVLGAGAWGTALALVLQQDRHRITLWGHDPAHLAHMAGARRNERYLPGIELPADWRYEADLTRAVAGQDCVVVAVPSKAIRDVGIALKEHAGVAVTVTKGIEYETGLTMSGVLAGLAPHARIAALSGPSLAQEVARGVPTAVVAASADLATAAQVQQLFHRPCFRVYTSPDVLGVELGGALKNVVAVAAGVGDGLGFGDNTKAALVTRAIVEIRRLGVACGAQAETFSGLSGLGDLTVTCFSRLSRNRCLGERLGRGERLEEILAGSTAIAEGYPTARAAHQLARRHGVATPIIDEVYALLYEGKPPAQTVADLTGRESKAEV